LALEAIRLLRAVGGTGRAGAPAAWVAPAFARQVEDVRADLGPIRSRDSLAASFVREAARFDSVRLAYAIRWLELGDGRSRPAWPQQLLDRGPRLT
jgi:hypothetical protein